jgi:transcriptional regulator with AAA-type ATPase domain
MFSDQHAEDAQDRSLRAWSRRYARLVLERCAGNKRRACEVLDITYHTLQSLLESDVPPAARPVAALRMEAGELCERAG